MEFLCYAWASTPSCYLNMFDKLRKQVFRTAGFLVTASLDPLGYRRNMHKSYL